MVNPYEQLDHSNEDDLNVCDEDLDEILQYVEDNIVKNNMPQVKQLAEFLSNDRLLAEKGDPQKNIWQQGGKFHQVKLEKRDDELRLFGLIDNARKAGVKDHWCEKQQSGEDPKIKRPAACIMIDLDIYQDEKERIVQDRHHSRLQHELSQIMLDRFELEEPHTGETTIYSAVTAKPQLKHDEKKGQWKDGYHIYIYGRLKRSAKRYLIRRMLELKVMTKVFGKEFKDPERFLDTACCHVPPLLYGNCKIDSQAYKLNSVYQWHIEEDGTCIIQKDEHFALSEHKLNHTLELSCNFDGRVIKKLAWKPKEEYSAEVDLLKKNTRHDTDEERRSLVDELNHLQVNDPEAAYLKSVLECLRPERYNNHTLRFKTIYALIKGHPQYIPLAKWFFKKSHKYEDSKFEDIIANCLTSDYQLDHQSLAHWASKDSPEKFKNCNDKSCFKELSRRVFEDITEGKLGHADFAEVVWLMLKGKYKTDMRGKKQRVWFEFRFPNDNLKRGQAYKWCEVGTPDGLSLYLHRKMDALTTKMTQYIVKKLRTASDKVVEAISKKLPAEQEKALKNYYQQVLKNFKSSARGLRNDGFKKGILNQCESVFDTPGFIESLDQGDMDLGVGNGVLQLSWDGRLPKLIKSYNTTMVSRFTSTPYKQFDPKDPLTRKLLRGLRGMHPDNETDAFEYLMCAMAASIDNRDRDQIVFLITGVGSNGKSFRFELHAAAMGEMYCTTLPIAMLLQSKEDNAEAPKPFMMKLEAARSAYYEEGPACAVLYMPMIKRITGCGIIPGVRDLFEAARTIKSRCYHYVLSNHDFIVLTHEEATWRRLRYLNQKMIFKDKLEFDPENPRHRIADHSFNQKFMYEEATRSAYLSIMTFFHMKLMKYHGGKVEHVPHPTIDRDTLAFRNRQDTLNRFITERMLISPSQEQSTPIEDVVQAYCTWYDNNIRQVKHYKQDITKQILDSALKDVIETTVYGSNLIKGYRVMDTSDIREDDVPFSKGAARAMRVKNYSMVFEDETPDDFLDRVEREWEDLMRAEKEERVDLTKTYDYQSDDEDAADGEVATDWKAKYDECDGPSAIAVESVEALDPIEVLRAMKMDELEPKKKNKRADNVDEDDYTEPITDTGKCMLRDGDFDALADLLI
jgi:phage/plasmid-associated DNA primase